MGTSGGSSSGSVEYPAYMKNVHSYLLRGKYHGDNSADHPKKSVIDVMNAAWEENPFDNIEAYDPTSNFDTLWHHLNTLNRLSFDTIVGDYYDLLTDVTITINRATDPATLDPLEVDSLTTYTIADLPVPDDVILNAVTDITSYNVSDITLTDIDDAIDDVVQAHSDGISRQITRDVLPKFKAGMRDVNAVLTSTFVLGEAMIYEGQLILSEQFEQDIRSKALLAERELSYQSENSKRQLQVQADLDRRDKNWQNDVRYQELRAKIDLDSRDKIEMGRASQRELEFKENSFRVELNKKMQMQWRELSLQSRMDRRKIIAEDQMRERDLEVQEALSRRQYELSKYEWALKGASAYTEFRRMCVHYIAEYARLKSVGMKEYKDSIATIEEARYKWDIDVFTYAGNLLGSIAGTAVQLPKRYPTPSVLGGALSGMGAGAMAGNAIAPGIGAPIGAGIGGLFGLLGSLF